MANGDRRRRASEHNLSAFDVVFKPGLTVPTGVSGSGKTSLVFDTLYQKARRRFLEVLSLGTAERPAPPRVRAITSLGPAVAVGQNLLNRNPSSTVATASGLHPFFRLLYANLGERHCARCGAAVSALSEDQIVERLVAWSAPGTLTLLAPLLRGARGSHRTLLGALEVALGREALRIDGAPYGGRPLDAPAPHDLDVVVGRWRTAATVSRAREAVGAALALAPMPSSSSATGAATRYRGRRSAPPAAPGSSTWRRRCSTPPAPTAAARGARGAGTPASTRKRRECTGRGCACPSCWPSPWRGRASGCRA